MEKRINKKICDYISTFKSDIKEQTARLGLSDIEDTTKLLQYIYDYERFSLNKDDFIKRKRVKNVVPIFERCCAKRACEEQCTRKKKDGYEYCGTHIKGVPHGIVDMNEKQSVKKIDVWAQNIKGIMYYLDNDGNVYQAEDILMNKMNPKKTGKYTKMNEEYVLC